MQSATGTLHSGSAAVINKQEQYEVFDNAYADDPTHSLLSKDHFALVRALHLHYFLFLLIFLHFVNNTYYRGFVSCRF
jgi:hypothetical protein